MKRQVTRNPFSQGLHMGGCPCGSHTALFVGLQAGHGQLWVRWTLPTRVLGMCPHCQAIVQLLLFLRQSFMSLSCPKLTM